MRKLTVALCAGVLALTGIACGDKDEGTAQGGGDPESVNALSAAADAASDAGSSRMTMTMSMDVSGQKVDMDAEGIFDFEEKIGEMSMEMTAPGLEGAVIDMIIEDQYVYMKMPPELGAGSGWTRMDMSSMPGVGPGGANQFSQDPSQYLDFLRGASDEIVEVGTEKVRGVSTTHYEADLSFDKILDQAPNQEAVEELRAQLEAFEGMDSIPSEVWIDDEGYPRRMSMTMSMEAEGQTMEMDITMDLFDYGVDVEITPPEKFQDVNAPVG